MKGMPKALIDAITFLKEAPKRFPILFGPNFQEEQAGDDDLSLLRKRYLDRKAVCKRWDEFRIQWLPGFPRLIRRNRTIDEDAVQHFLNFLSWLDQSRKPIEELVKIWETVSSVYDLPPNSEEVFKKARDVFIFKYSHRLPISAELNIDEKGRFRLEKNPIADLLVPVEASRIRRCPRCRNIFWAGRKDQRACTKCRHALRQKEYRENKKKKPGVQ